jgi:hypothetical protein
MIPTQEDHADELDVSHHSCIDSRGIVPFDADLPMYSRGSVLGSVASCRPSSRVSHLALRIADASALVAGMTRTTGLVLSPCAMRALGIEPCLCSGLP